MPRTAAEPEAIVMAEFETLYPKLLEKLREMANVATAQNMLNWDMWTAMPTAAADTRAKVVAYFADKSHELEVDPRYAEIITPLEELRKAGKIDPESAAWQVVRDCWDSYWWEQSLPKEFVAERNLHKAAAYPIWENAKEAKSWANFLPTFAKTIALSRQEVAFVRSNLQEPEPEGLSPFDYLLDHYDSGMTCAKADAFFASIIPTLVSLRERIAGSGIRYGTTSDLQFVMNPRVQAAVCRRVAKQMGFDFDAGVLVRTTHPFSIPIHRGHQGIATRYLARDPLWAVYGVVHEAGHGMYDQACERLLSDDLCGTSVAYQMSYGMHETQSRLWERLIGTGRPFLEYLERTLRRYHRAPPSAEAMYKVLNNVRSSHIRFEACEVTYNLHVAIRHQTERELFEGRLDPQDFMDAWRVKYREYLGLEITCDSQGPLQDSHYSDGLGSFLGYSLGNVWGPHIMEAVRRDIPHLDASVRLGSFGEVREWLATRLYKYGGQFEPEKVIALGTGSAPTTDAFKRYITAKYEDLYKL